MKWSFLLRFSLVFVLSVTCFVDGQSDVPKPSEAVKVFIVQSYESDNVCGRPQEQGVLDVLKEEYGDRLTVETHYMNTKTVNSAKEAMQADAVKVLAQIDAYQPDIVFTVDDNALREVGLKLAGRSFPVVFSGMNAQPEVYNAKVPFLDDRGLPASNITGVYEKLHVQTGLEVMKGIMPDLKKVVALLDKTPTGKAIAIQLKKELEDNHTGIEMEFRHVGTIQELLEQVDQINQDPDVGAIYNVVLSVKDDDGKSVDMKKTFRELLLNSEKPAMALNFAFCKLGLFGGASVDFVDMGNQAGRMGIQLLKGVPIGTMPIHSPEKYLITFNYACAQRLGITIPDEVLSVAILYNEEPLLKK